MPDWVYVIGLVTMLAFSAAYNTWSAYDRWASLTAGPTEDEEQQYRGRVGSKAVEEDRSYRHYTIFGVPAQTWKSFPKQWLAIRRLDRRHRRS